MNRAIEEWGTTVQNLGRQVRRSSHGHLAPKKQLAVARQLLFDCWNVVLRAPLRIRLDYLLAHKKCHEPLWEGGGPKCEESAHVCAKMYQRDLK